MTGQAFHPSDRIIGKQDASGNIVLVVDPATLPPEIYDALCRLGISGTELGRNQEQSPGHVRYSSDQSPAGQDG